MRKPRFNPLSTLAAYWSDKEGDIIFHHPDYSWNGHLLHYAFNVNDMGHGKNLIQELESRGFDITTLRFTIELKEKCYLCRTKVPFDYELMMHYSPNPADGHLCCENWPPKEKNNDIF